MINKTLKTTAYNFLKTVEIATIYEIFENVKKEMKDIWDVRFSNKSEKDLLDTKLGELYTLLSIDGAFTVNSNQKWSLTENYTFEEVQKMKINIGENDDIDLLED